MGHEKRQTNDPWKSIWTLGNRNRKLWGHTSNSLAYREISYDKRWTKEPTVIHCPLGLNIRKRKPTRLLIFWKPVHTSWSMWRKLWRMSGGLSSGSGRICRLHELWKRKALNLLLLCLACRTGTSHDAVHLTSQGQQLHLYTIQTVQELVPHDASGRRAWNSRPKNICLQQRFLSRKNLASLGLGSWIFAMNVCSHMNIVMRFGLTISNEIFPSTCELVFQVTPT
jgi:hypothetical protein